MAAPVRPQVEQHEVAILVLQYLEGHGWRKAATAFRREAKTVFGAAHPIPENVRPLADVLNEYVALKAREHQRIALQTINPIAQSMYAMLDMHAGLPQQVPGPVPTLDAAQTAAIMPSAAHGTANVPVQQNNQQPSVDHHATPGRHSLRKRPPKRRRQLDAAFEATRRPHSASLGLLSSPENSKDPFDPHKINLLNRRMNIERLEELMTDTAAQQNFAEPLAQHINHLLDDHSLNSIDFGSNLDPEVWLQPVFEDPRLATLVEQLAGAPVDNAGGQPTLEIKNRDGQVRLASQQRQEPRETEAQVCTDARNAGIVPGKEILAVNGQLTALPSSHIAVNEVDGSLDRHPAANAGAGADLSVAILEYMNCPEAFEDLINECVR